MATVTNKRKVSSVEGKVKAIRQIENGKKKADADLEFGLISSTSKMIWKNRTKIISAFEQTRLRITRFRKAKRSDVDEVILAREK
jgi:hypothetical protein